MAGRRVVVTGLGVVSPVGVGKEPFWEGVTGGSCGVGPITRFDASGCEVRIAAEVKDFNPKEYVAHRKALKLMKDDMKMAVGAAKMAVDDSGLTMPAADPGRVGVVIGASILSTDILELASAVEASLREGEFDMVLFGDEGRKNLLPIWMLKQLPNMSASHISIASGAQGVSNTITTGGASGAQAVGEAFRIVERGDGEIVLAGGADTAITPLAFLMEILRGDLSVRNEEPERASRPFDRGRDGKVIGEGAAVLVLEELGHARARSARIYAEIIGYGSSVDMCGRGGAGSPAGEKAASMKRALRDAGLPADSIDYINAQGDGIPDADVVETEAIKAVFGERARAIAVSSVKSMTGDLGAAAGAVEAVATVLAIARGVVPPTINLDDPDPACDLDYVPLVARDMEVGCAMSNSFSRFGHNATLIFRRPE